MFLLMNTHGESGALDLEIVGSEPEYGSASFFFDCMVNAAGDAHAKKASSKRRPKRLSTLRPSLVSLPQKPLQAIALS